MSRRSWALRYRAFRNQRRYWRAHPQGGYRMFADPYRGNDAAALDALLRTIKEVAK